jgi:hypothetical protein
MMTAPDPPTAASPCRRRTMNHRTALILSVAITLLLATGSALARDRLFASGAPELSPTPAATGVVDQAAPAEEQVNEVVYVNPKEQPLDGQEQQESDPSGNSGYWDDDHDDDDDEWEDEDDHDDDDDEHEDDEEDDDEREDDD